MQARILHSKQFTNKKVLLFERKRHTARRVSNTQCAALSGHGGVPLPGQDGVPPARQPGWGTPPGQGGVPASPSYDGIPPPSWPRWGNFVQTHRHGWKHYLPHPLDAGGNYFLANFKLCCSFVLYLEDGYLDVDLGNLPEVWTHVVLNYAGMGMGIKTYENGRFTGADTTKDGFLNTPADGRLVVGRSYTGDDTNYASLKLDELMLFNSTLSEEQIEDLSAHVWDCDISGHSRLKLILLSSLIRFTQCKCIVIVKIKPDTSSFWNTSLVKKEISYCCWICELAFSNT